MNSFTEHSSLTLPPSARKALDLLEDAGHESWCVGGFVRDALRGVPAHDIDIATEAHWQTSKVLLESAGYKVFETGIKHGTLTVMLEGSPVEITTFRQEGTYSDSRHPDTVEFVSRISDDLARRDFTMNAIAYHPTRGFYDPYGGQKDIDQQRIKAVGVPSQRFSEDALRILRACRFASQLGFTVENPTRKAMDEAIDLLDNIAAERIAAELEGFFCGKGIHDALLEFHHFIEKVIPEAQPMHNFDQRTPYHIYDVLEHTAYCMQHCPPDSLVRWAAFFHDIGKPAAFFTDETGVGHFYGHARISVDLAQAAMRRLKLPRAFMHDVLLLVRQHDDLIAATPKAVKRALRRLDERPDLFRALCALKRGDALAQAPHCHERVSLADELEEVLDALLAQEEAFSLKDLAVTGSDIIALGVEPGPAIGSLLEAALDAVIEETVDNDRTALLRFAKEWLKLSD